MGFKDLKKNESYNYTHATEKIATVFDQMPHPQYSNIICGIRFADGKELLISQEGLTKHTGFKVGDMVVIEKTDFFYTSQPAHDHGKPVKVIKETYISTSTDNGDEWTGVRFSDNHENVYQHLRYATSDEIEKMKPKVFKFEIGDAATQKLVSVSTNGITVDVSGTIVTLGIRDLQTLITEMNSFRSDLKSKYWRMSIDTITIGCTKNVTYDQLKNILDKAESLGVKN
jgi:hypothetical protein